MLTLALLHPLRQFLPLPAEGTTWGQGQPLPSPPALESLLVLGPGVTLKSPAEPPRHASDWAAPWEIRIGWVRGAARASAFSNAPPAASGVQPELGAAGQQRPPRCCVVGESPVPRPPPQGSRCPISPSPCSPAGVSGAREASSSQTGRLDHKF